MTIPPIGKARVERRKYRAAVLSRGVIGGKVRVGQGGGITGGGKLRGLAIPMPDTATDSVAMLEVFNPARASLKLVLRDPERFCDIPGPVADQRVGKSDILRDCTRRQPIDELALDLGELGRSDFGERQRQGAVRLK